MGWVGLDLCAELFYEHRFAMLIKIQIKIQIILNELYFRWGCKIQWKRAEQEAEIPRTQGEKERAQKNIDELVAKLSNFAINTNATKEEQTSSIWTFDEAKCLGKRRRNPGVKQNYNTASLKYWGGNGDNGVKILAVGTSLTEQSLDEEMFLQACQDVKKLSKGGLQKKIRDFYCLYCCYCYCYFRCCCCCYCYCIFIGAKIFCKLSKGETLHNFKTRWKKGPKSKHC